MRPVGYEPAKDDCYLLGGLGQIADLVQRGKEEWYCLDCDAAVPVKLSLWARLVRWAKGRRPSTMRRR